MSQLDLSTRRIHQQIGMGAEQVESTEQGWEETSQYVSGCHLRDGDQRATGHSLLVVLKLEESAPTPFMVSPPKVKKKRLQPQCFGGGKPPVEKKTGRRYRNDGITVSGLWD